jgi:protein-L-isoaspartate O-methyltransferase
MPLDDLEFMVQKMSALSIGVGDLETLVHFCRDKELVVELGTNTGSTSMVLSMIAKRVCTVDVFECIEMIEDDAQRQAYESAFYLNRHTYGRIKEKLRPFGVEVHQGMSHEFADKFNSCSVDSLFIDADHSYAGVKRDYDAWFDKVKVGGHFIFHDVVPSYPVFRYVQDVVMFDHRVERVPFEMVGKGSTAVFRKK